MNRGSHRAGVAIIPLAVLGVLLIVVGTLRLRAESPRIPLAAPAPSTFSPAPVDPSPTDPAAVVAPARPPRLEPEGRPGNAAGSSLNDRVRPVRVRIADIDLSADVLDLGLAPDGTLEVPEDYDLTGWYTGRPVPGEPGPSVIVGHVDSWQGPAVFFRLGELTVGETVQVDRSDGLVAEFRVSEAVTVDKNEFPTALVYGPTDLPTLRLITCGGRFDRSTRSYTANVIIFAEHLGNARRPASTQMPPA